MIGDMEACNRFLHLSIVKKDKQSFNLDVLTYREFGVKS
jgi:hypothetical protein